MVCQQKNSTLSRYKVTSCCITARSRLRIDQFTGIEREIKSIVSRNFPTVVRLFDRIGRGECQIGKNNDSVVKSCTSPLLSCHMYHRHHPPPSHASSHSQCNYAFRIAIALKKEMKKKNGKTKKEKKGNIRNIEMVMDKISMLADTATFSIVRTNNEVVESKR